MANNRRSGMSPVLAFILGFLLALILVIGAVVGGVVYALNYKLDNLEFNKDEEENYIFVNADPDGDTATILQLVNKVLSMTNDTSSLTLAQVEETFPVANKLSDSIYGALGQYVEIDMDKLKQTAFAELGTFLQDSVMDVRPAALINSFGGELGNIQLLRKVLYDSEDNPVTLRQFTDGSALENLKASPVLEVLGSSESEYDELTHQFLGDMTIGDFIDGGMDLSGKVKKLTLATFVSVNLTDGKPDTATTILSYVVYGLTNINPESGTVGENAYTHTATYNSLEGEKIHCFVNAEDGKITRVFYEGEEGIVEVSGTPVKEVSNRASGVTKDLTINQIMDVSGNKILEKIGASTIENLAENINGLAINELYAENIYSADAKNPEKEVSKYLAVNEIGEATEFHAGWIYYVLKDGNYELANTTGKLSEFKEGETYYTCGAGNILFDTAYVYYDGKDGEILNKGKDKAGKVTAYAENLYTYGAANAMWKLLLYKENKDELAFSVNDFTTIIDNVSNNVQKSTLRELHEAGIIDMKEGIDNLNKPIIVGEYTGTLLGDLTLEQLIDYFSDLAVGNIKFPLPVQAN